MKAFLSNKTGFFLCIFVISILLNTYTARADMPDDHKPIPCIGCHQETLGAWNGRGECGDCHKYKFITGGINVPKMEAEHNPNICTACHIGNTELNGSERDVFHNAHNTIQCIECHLSQDGSAVLRIKEGKAFQCTSCHGTKIHSIHAANISKGCPICHGSWAAGKTTYNPSQSAKTQKNTNLEQFTIFDILKNIFGDILKAI